ncbi:MAG: YggT family protein [Oligoflexales bacterium]|nr:YggT family protein [Oligoflexales bacterium]
MGGSFLYAIMKVLLYLLSIVKFLVIVSIIISWIGDPRNQIVQMINQVTEPLYRPFRGLARRIPGPLDWTPVIVLAIVFGIEQFIISFVGL